MSVDASVREDPADQAGSVRTIRPLGRPLQGSIRVPGDKSLSHRAVLFGAMAEGTTRVSGVLDSQDVRSSVAAVTALGAKTDLAVQPDGSLAGTVEGWGSAGPRQPDGPIDCGNSGTTARLLMGVIAPWDVEVTLTGDSSLQSRPMRRITAPLMKMGAEFFPAGREHLPLTERGCASLAPLHYASPMASAQLKSAILLAGIYAHGETSVVEPAPSRNHTELMLPQFGVPTMAGEREAAVTGPATPRACALDVPGDPSSAAFLVCAALLKPESAVEITDVSLNPTRIGFVRTLERMGADVSVSVVKHVGKEPVGTITARFTARLRGCEVPASKIASIVDEIPVLSLVAAHAAGITVFRQVGELRVKETDRLRAVIEGLALMGVDAWEEGDDLFIEGQPGLHPPAGLSFDTGGDHRLAMTWALAGLCGNEPVSVRDFGCVSVSYPGFINDIERLAS